MKKKNLTKKEKRKKFDKIVEDIKNVKIQGAQNIAKKSLFAYSLIPTKRSRKKLLSIRPTEPLMKNVLDKIEKGEGYEEIMSHFNETQGKINKFVLKLVKNKDVIFTHCHSSTVSKALINAKNKGKRFEVYVTETRPLYQGKKTARELSKAGIKTTFFVDSAAMIALTKNQQSKKANKFFLGADALLNKGVLNKVGSGMFTRIAWENKIPVHILADSWKYTKKKVKIEQRSFKEIWQKKPPKLKIKNPAFEFVPKKYIKTIVSETGVLTYDKFLKSVNTEKSK